MNILMNLLQEGPLETTGYMVAGYIVFFSVMALYLVSLLIRHRNLKLDLEVLNEVSGEDLEPE